MHCADSHLNLVPFPKRLPDLRATAGIVEWARAQPRSFPSEGPEFQLSWRVMQDTDGAIIVIPSDPALPGIVITLLDEDHVNVLVCDPDNMEELGPFSSIADALAGTEGWLSSKCLVAERLGHERGATAIHQSRLHGSDHRSRVC